MKKNVINKENLHTYLTSKNWTKINIKKLNSHAKNNVTSSLLEAFYIVTVSNQF